jgi:hypothetical protein
MSTTIRAFPALLRAARGLKRNRRALQRPAGSVVQRWFYAAWTTASCYRATIRAPACMLPGSQWS